MYILTVADCHGKLTEKEMKNQNGLADGLPNEFPVPDIVLYLGDNNTDDIECVQDWVKSLEAISGRQIPQLGVFGNHDTPSILEHCGIENIHAKVVTVNGLRIGGFGGSINYKESSVSNLFTHEESIKLMNDMPECELLVTHSNPQYRQCRQVDVTPKPRTLLDKLKYIAKPPKPKYDYFTEPFKNDCHAGLVGIGDYIENRHPKLHLYGHLHERKEDESLYTLSRCCYGIELIYFSF